MGIITFQCYSCQQLLRVDGDKGGKKSKCPHCATILTIPMPSNSQELVQATPGQAPAPHARVDDRVAPIPAAGKGSYGPPLTLAAILLLVGAGLLLVNAFLPWWRISIRLWSPEEEQGKTLVDKIEYKKNVKEFLRIRRDSTDWYADHLSSRDRTSIKMLGMRDEFGTEPEFKFSRTLLGINLAAGILGFAFAVIIVAPVLVGVFVRFVRPWLWISSVIAALLGLVELILAVISLVAAPGESAGDVFRQGIIVGPWLALGGSLIVFVAGILDMIFGLRRFVRWLRGGCG